MKRLLISLCLVVVILISFSYAILRLFAFGPEGSSFNEKVRPKISYYPVLRNFFGFHEDGDAASDYLSDRYDRIILEVDVMQGLEVSDLALDILKDKISTVTGKEVLVAKSSTLPYLAEVTNQDIENLVKQYKNFNGGKSAKIYLLYISQFVADTAQLGSTHRDDTIVLADSALRSFTVTSPDTLDYYVESTALHEFGHQMGLSHNSEPDCLMAEVAEHGRYGIESPSDVIVDFCEYEQKLIRTFQSRS